MLSRLAPSTLLLALWLGASFAPVPAQSSAVASSGLSSSVLVGAPTHGEAPHGDAGHGDAGHGDAEHAEGAGRSPMAIVVNTILFFGLLGWFAGPWLLAWFRKRKAQIETDLSAAQRAREQAEAKLAQMEKRLAAVEGEVTEILDTASAQATAEKQRILTGAQSEAARLLVAAETQVGELEAQAGRRLRETAADLSVGLARQLVEKKLAGEDRQRLFEAYVEGLNRTAG